MENVQWFDCLRLGPEIFDRYLERLERWRPSAIIAYAGALGAFAEHLDERGIRVSEYPQRFVTGAEKLLLSHRTVIERVFGRPVHERYGSRDVALMGFQTRPDKTLDLEIDWANVLVEPETEEPESALLVTKLHADGMPMIRYRVGDIGRFRAGARPGHPVFTLHEVLGRDVDRIWMPGGQWVHGISFPHLMKDHGVATFQIVQESDYSVTVSIVPRTHLGRAEIEAIRHLIQLNLKSLPVTVEVVGEIARTRSNKWRPVVSRIHSPERATQI
jgi:phenylacetate-CoA ligase